MKGFYHSSKWQHWLQLSLTTAKVSFHDKGIFLFQHAKLESETHVHKQIDQWSKTASYTNVQSLVELQKDVLFSKADYILQSSYQTLLKYYKKEFG